MNDKDYIKECLSLAKQAKVKNEIPIGALIIKDGVVISKSHNLSISLMPSSCEIM